MTAPGGPYAAFRPELHPRDRHGRFRDKWGLPKSAQKLVDGIVSAFQPKTFRDDADAQDYLDRKAIKERVKHTPKQKKALDDFTGDGFSATQAKLRKGDTSSPEVAEMDSMMRPLEDDVLLTRVMGANAFGLPPERIGEVEEWTGKLIADKGYQPTNIGTPFQVDGPHVTMSILTPKGTPAIVPGGSREVILDRDQPLRVVKVTPDGRGGVYVYAVAQPKGDGRTRALGRAIPKGQQAPATEATPEELRRRGLETPEAPAREQTPQVGDVGPTTTRKEDITPQGGGATGSDRRAAARERQKAIDEKAKAADLLEELDELVGKDTGARVFRQRLNHAEDTGAIDKTSLDQLRKATETNDKAKIRAAITRVSVKNGITPVGRAGQVVKFDENAHEPVGDAPGDGAQVKIIRRGSVANVNGEKVPLTRAKVTTAFEQAAKEAKAPKTPKVPEDLTISQLKEIADKNNIKLTRKNLTKPEIIHAIRDWEKGRPPVLPGTAELRAKAVRERMDKEERAAADWKRWNEDRDVDISLSNLPKVNPENPLAAYGNRLTIQSPDNKGVRAHLSALETMPTSAHEKLQRHFAEKKNSGFFIGNTSVVDLDSLREDLADEKPRGWSEGSTWEDVCGVYSPYIRVCGIGDVNLGSGSKSLALHEAGHALDHAADNNSRTSEWRKTQRKIVELSSDLGISPYYTPEGNPAGHVDETWAEAYANWVFHKDDKDNQDRLAKIGRKFARYGNRDETIRVGKLIDDYFTKLERRKWRG